jgi:RNA polymerase sigma-70 factor (ECF subfamily)
MTSAVVAIDWSAELDRNRPWMLKILRSRVGDAHSAEDCLQNVALAVWKQESRPELPEKVAPWLYRLTVRAAINFHRHRGRRPAVALVEDNRVPADHQSEPLDWLLEQERDGELRQALHRLKARDREILVLKYTQGWSYKQLADHLGVKPKTIEYRLMKSRQQMRRMMQASQTV